MMSRVYSMYDWIAYESNYIRVRKASWCSDNKAWTCIDSTSNSQTNRLNQYRNYRLADQAILPPFLQNGVSYTGKTSSLYWIRA